MMLVRILLIEIVLALLEIEFNFFTIFELILFTFEQKHGHETSPHFRKKESKILIFFESFHKFAKTDDLQNSIRQARP